MSTWSKLKPYLWRSKVLASEAETAREYSEWYNGRWKSEYPDLYAMRYSTAMRRRPRRPLYARPRRRLMVVDDKFVTKRSKRRKKTYAKRKMAIKQLGEPVGSSTGKRVVVFKDTSPTLISSNVLYFSNSADMLEVEQGTAINQRLRRLINVRGLEIRAFLRMGEAKLVTKSPLYVHLALVHPKTDSSVAIDFFRADNSNRGLDFSSAGALQMVTSGLNTDKLDIYFHKKYKLSQDGRYGAVGLGNHILFRKYVRLNRQIRYESDAANSAQDQLYFCVWCSTSESDASGNQLVDVLSIDRYCVLHFREPRND